MVSATQSKSVDKKAKRRGASQSPKTKIVKGGEVKDENSSKSGIKASVSADSLTKVQHSLLDDPAVVSTGQSRPLADSTKSNTIQAEKKDSEKSLSSNRKRSERGSPTVPKAPRAMRKDRTATQSKKQDDGKVDDVTSTVASKIAAFEHKGNTPVVATSARRDSIKGKRDHLTAKNSLENAEEKKNTVRFQTETVSNKKSIAEKPTDRKAIASETLAQQAAIQDAAAMLAQNPLAVMANNPLYANLLATNLAQQQLATAQVLANLRASVSGFRPMKNYESPSAYDASCVPCLSNREDVNTTTNIYVNNLPAHTTDDDLLRLGTCFGPVKSHKAIINQETGLCKGYGFVMYESPRDAETALQQLPLHGLTTSWAKESFSTKLRKLSDHCSTNVYISNLPLDMTPHQLEQLFAPHFVVSLRILLDDSGTSRGVGFVRLRDRDIAQDSIDKLHGKILPGQTSPLQARFADSEAQKRLKQTANPTGNDAKNNASTIKTTGGLLDPNVGLMDPLYLASLQGLQNWTGFGTPQNPSAAAFASPQLDMTSPTLNYAQFSPNLAASNGVNWSHLMNTADLYGNNFFNSPAGAGMLGLNYQNSLYSPNSIATSLTSPMAQMSNKSLSPMSFINTPMSDASPMTGKFDGMQKRMGNDRMKPTYLPAEMHQQHAKALLEAQSRLAFGMTSNEGLEGQDAMMNALGMTGVTTMGPAPQKQNKGSLSVQQEERVVPGQTTSTTTTAKEDTFAEKGKVTPRHSKGSEFGGTSISLTEDGDSLVIDSGSASSIGRFSDQPEKTSVYSPEGNTGMTKSDSGKVFSAEESNDKIQEKESKVDVVEDVESKGQLITA